jgi:hypothetical protein
MMQHKSDVKYQQRAGVNSPGSQRMMAAGIKAQIHEMYRMRFFSYASNQAGNGGGPEIVNSALPPLEKSDDQM